MAGQSRQPLTLASFDEFLGSDLRLDLADYVNRSAANCSSQFSPRATMAHIPLVAVEDVIISNFNKGEWRALLAEKFRETNKFLPWIWPNEDNLIFISKSAQELGTCRIVSIGCGFGLLEWLINQATGMAVKGVEVDRAWWASKSCQHKFIPLDFAEDLCSGYRAAETTDAILFCYFNNESAFLSYLQQYDGPCLIIIGPDKSRGTYTCPEPFSLPTVVQQEWTMHSVQEVHSGKDFIVVYKRSAQYDRRGLLFLASLIGP